MAAVSRAARRVHRRAPGPARRHPGSRRRARPLLLVAHDRQQPKASRTGLPDITTGTGLADDRTRDTAREYVRAEWAARQER
ncbi:hypothetical protein [Streptomyces gibsoniae]|uniref:Uncharacterized protein n=1 Tax=Streptomyces gibsoniae TaxID=3075529 RepID=A0ABU2U1M9_9ACTN|nr:hypothetical protein [Streptomyces sp. DSM 41699]MDT0467079.1 hypothetical protein [Streptomyces sp. DSM 41699]